MKEAYQGLRAKAKKEAARVGTVSRIREKIDSLLDQSGKSSLSDDFTTAEGFFRVTILREERQVKPKGSLVPVTETRRSITVDCTIEDERDRLTLSFLGEMTTHIEVKLGNEPTLRLEPTFENLELFEKVSGTMKVKNS
jgi:hypothetical protein